MLGSGVSRVVAIADLHGNLPAGLPGGDVLVIAGDVCPLADHDPEFQAGWLERELYPWMASLPHEVVIWIAGNHDFVCELPKWEPAGRGHYLRDSRIELGGLSFYGTPWVPHLPRWAFHAGEEQLASRMAAIPEVDVLISHGPPLGTGDRLARGGRAGSTALRTRLEEAPPQLCVFGHIHEDHGRWQQGAMTLANVAHVDADYRVRPNAVGVFEVKPSR